MGLRFTWHSEKATANLSKHDVSFEEATTVFGDPLSLTIRDPVHSEDETRFVLIGQSFRGRLLVVVHTEVGDSIRGLRHGASGELMSKDNEVDEMRAEYDFSEGVRGKYAERYAQGTNVVVLDPDVAAEFKTAEDVNKALREIVEKRRASG